MFRHLFFLFNLLPFELTDPLTPDPAKPDPAKPTGKPDGVTDEIQTWINGIIAKAESEARKKGRSDAQAEADRIKAEADAAAKLAADEAAGNYETAKKALEEERDGLKTTNSQLIERIDELVSVIEDDVTNNWDALPEEIREMYDGADDDVLGKRKHIARTAKLAEKLNGSSIEKPGTPRDPKPGDSTELPERILPKRLLLN